MSDDGRMEYQMVRWQPLPTDMAEEVRDLKTALRRAINGGGIRNLQQLARATGIPDSTLSDAVGRRAHVPTEGNFKKILSASGSPPLEDSRYESWPDLYKCALRAVKHDRISAVASPAAGADLSWLPRQLPPALPSMVGREQDLEDLDRHREASQAAGRFPSVVISGRVGIGKTTLAVSWGHAVRGHYADGQLFAHVGRPGKRIEDQIAELCGQLLRGLGVPAERVPVGVDEQVALYRSVTAGKALLLVLDDVVSCRQVRPFLLESPGMVVVTSRHRLDGLVGHCGLRVQLAPLGGEAAIDLVRGLVGDERVSRELSSARELVELCDRLPLALCIAAAHLKSGPDRTLAVQVVKLRDERRRISRLSIRNSLSVRASIDVSYRELSGKARRLYRVLSLHPGEDFPGELAAALAGESEARSGDILDILVEAGLLEEKSDGNYAYADLIRLHARQRSLGRGSKPERTATKTCIIEWYLLSARNADRMLTPYRDAPAYRAVHPVATPMSFLDRKEALRWLDRQRRNLMAVTRMAGEMGLPETTWHLCDAVWSLFLYRRHYRDRLEIDRLGVESARAWGSKPAEADMAKRLGRLHGLMGDFGQAVRLLEEAIVISRACGARICEADALADLGRVLHDLEDATGADRAISEAVRLYQAAGDERRVALALINKGLVRLQAGDGHDAVAQLGRALAILDRYREIDPYNHARALIALAKAVVRVGRHADATGYLTEGAEIMGAYDSQYRLAEISMLRGEIADASGDRDGAVRHYRSAMRTYLVLGADEARRLEQKIGALDEGG
jgi:tetratricopeptide (TPR) repeat protein